MPQHGNDEIEMVGVQAGHETAHTRSADLSGPASSPPSGTGPSSIACLCNRTSSESLSQKQPQAAQSAHTCGKPPGFGIPKAGMPGGGRPNIPGMAAAVENSRTDRVMASYRRLPSLAVNPDTSSGFAESTADPDSFTNGASPLRWRPPLHH